MVYFDVMVNRKYRATRTGIESTIKSGSTVFGTVMYAKLSRNHGHNPSFAIVVSKKVEKTSVGRHRLKRKISSTLEEAIPEMKADFKKTIVFFVKDAKNLHFYAQAEKDMKEILIKADFFEKKE